MSDLDNAINSINASAAKAENTASFLDDMSTFDDQSSVTNPNNGQTVASIPKQVKDRTDELFTAAESDINQAVADAAQSATDAQDAADSIGRYQGLWPDTGGIADKGDTYQTQVSGTPTGQYFTALQNTTADPVSDDVNWREIVSVASLSDYGILKYATVSDMVSGNPTAASIGDRCSTGGTLWSRVSTSSGNISDFSPITEIYLSDYGDDLSSFIGANTEFVNLFTSGESDLSDTLGVSERGYFLEGQSYDTTIVNFNPSTIKPAFKFENGANGTERLLRTGLSNIAINGADIGNTATGNNAVWGNNLHFFTMDKVFATRFNITGEYAFRFTGGDFSTSQFGMLNRISNSIADGCAGGLRIGNTTSGQDGPVNASLIEHNRFTGLNDGSGVGINMRKGFANTFLCNDVELFDVAYSIGDNGNCIVGGDIESNGKAFLVESPNSSIYGESGFTEDYVLDFDVFGGVCSSLTDIWGDGLHFNIDRYKGLIRQRSIDTTSENLILNGDFENGSLGGGKWDTSRLSTDKSIQGDYSLKFTNATDPSGGFVFAPDRFMQNTWYTISCWVNVDDTVTNTPALRMRVGASDTGYKSGLSDIDGRALNLTGNAGTAPSNLPSNAMLADGKWRRYVFSFNSGTNTDFPSALEFYTPSGVTGGSFYVDCIKVEEGSVGTMFTRSPLDEKNINIGDGSNTTLDVFGGSHLGDATSGSYSVTLPDASITAAGTKWIISKISGSNRINLFPFSGQLINGSSGQYSPPFFDTLYNSISLECNGVDGWTVVAKVDNS
ncbi:coil containing protein [Vibrio phage 1.263.B._10N.286.51.B1]|nr:coil containing protein [Vibrio phage 1.263.A._10N.286.51.B1]AUR99289.1 coil containing protein [Vibrio phage 1.263.B._10N.286.51.B1]